jgi:hypothetical protein
MATNLVAIGQWAVHGVNIGAQYLIVRATSDRSEEYPLYVMEGSSIDATIKTTPLLDHTCNVLDLRFDISKQLAQYDLSR